jgi:NAD-dependent deacetylase
VGQVRPGDAGQPGGLQRRPGRRLALVRRTAAAAHHTLAAWEQRWTALGRSFTHATQNIDGLHHRAGARRVLELHGNIWQARPLEGSYAEAQELAESPLAQLPPRDGAGRLLRPHVVWFGELLDGATLAEAEERASRCDLMLSVGTSSAVYPAAGLPYRAQRHGAVVVEVNPADTDLTPFADYALRGPAGEVLPRLWAAVEQLAPAGAG